MMVVIWMGEIAGGQGGGDMKGREKGASVRSCELLSEQGEVGGKEDFGSEFNLYILRTKGRHETTMQKT
jgi:hypothetical protein